MRSWSTYLGLSAFLALTLLPLLLGAGYALLYSLGLVGILSEGFTLANWEEVLQSFSFWETMIFSAYVAFLAIGLAVALALWVVVRRPAAFAGGTLSFFIYLPLAIPAIVMAFFIFQLLSKGGWFSRLSYQLGWIKGLQQFPDWVNDNYGIGIIVAHLLMALPFFIILFTNMYENERLRDLSQQALTLGARQWQADWRVAAPVLFRRAFATIVLYFLFVMGSYEIPLLLGSQSRRMVSVLTIQKLQRFNLADIPQAYTISVVYTVIVVGLVFWLLGRRH